MGNTSSYDLSTKHFTLEEREAMKKFCEEDINLLRETFKGLADSNHGYNIDKETFLKCFSMPGLLGERLFEVIDKDGSGAINFSEFVCGLAVLFRGSRREKLRFIFNLYDLSESGSISKSEFVTMMNQFPPSAIDLFISTNSNRSLNLDNLEMIVEDAFPFVGPEERITFDQFIQWCENTPDVASFLMSLLPYEDGSSKAAMADIVPLDITSTCTGSPSKGKGETSLIKKRRHSLKNLSSRAPPLTSMVSSPSSSTSKSSPMSRASSLASLGSFVGVSSTPSPKKHSRANSNHDNNILHKTRKLLVEAQENCVLFKSESLAEKLKVAIDELDQIIDKVNVIVKQVMEEGEEGEEQAVAEDPDTSIHGELWKRGSRLRQMLKRYYVLQGNFLYYYSTREDTEPRGVTFMCGCYIEPSSAQNGIVKDKNMTLYGFDIVPEPGSGRSRRTVYAKSQEERSEWIAALTKASNKVSIEEFYQMGKLLGRGRFSKVCEATHKETKVKFAAKIIDKSKLSATEKELLRTEIAILKLVRHPHIILLADVYEDMQHIYLVTELVSGGELFNRIVGRSRYTEAEARLVMQPLLESVAYLHKHGIVHRDIKPENILCGDNLNDLKIADFGLSKLVYPQEILKMPCGTLNYVAPEVLSLVGYGKEADIWSVGVIFYLLLRGELPFHGKTKNDIIQKTLHAEINLDSGSSGGSLGGSASSTNHHGHGHGANGMNSSGGGSNVWKTISPAAKSLLRGLLTKDPAKRLTAEQALAHEWFTTATTTIRRNSGMLGLTPSSPITSSISEQHVFKESS